MNKKLIVDSSPLIVLLKSDLEHILPELFEEIIVPEEVWQEVLAGKPNDIAKQKGLIPSVSEAIAKVQDAGLWLSDKIIEMIIEKAKE